MKVLYVSKALVVAAYRDKLRALAAHAEVSALVPDRWSGEPVEPGDDPRLRIETRAVLFRGHNHLHVYRGARRTLERIRPELVHIDEEPYSAVTFQFARLCRRLGVPAICFGWQNLDKRLPPPFGAMRARVFRSMAGAIAGTQQAGEVLRRAGYRGRMAVIPQFGVDAARFAPDPEARRRVRALIGAAEDEFVIGFGGRLVREKGVHLLLDAVRALPGARLVVLGEGPERARLEADARGAGLAGRVHFAGRVPSLDVARWLPAFDALALPSLRRPGWVEQFGRILVEAMSCGVPVVGSASGEIPRVIGDGGLVVPEGDVRALTAALGELAGRPETRAELSRRARCRVLAHFTQERVAAETAGFYRMVLEAERRG